MPTALKTWLASAKSASILVQEPAALMLVARLSTIILFVVVRLAIPVIRSSDVFRKKVSMLIFTASVIIISFTSTLLSLIYVCLLPTEPMMDIPSGDPCVPSPCGPNSQCRVVGSTPACSCLPNYVGRSPNCRPECTISPECPGNLACFNEKCLDPCPGSCGSHAHCTVVNHIPLCTCDSGYTGDPFKQCRYVEPRMLLHFIFFVYKLPLPFLISL